MVKFSTVRQAAVLAVLFVLTLPALSVFANPGNTPPRLAPIGDRVAPVGFRLEFDIVATDGDGDVLTFSAAGLPAGVLFDPQTGHFNWLPNFADIGQHTVTFTVTDNGSPQYSVSETVTLIVPAALQVVSGRGQFAVVGNTFAKPLRVRVVNGVGSPLSGEIVTFRVASASARFDGESQVQVMTDADGYADAPILTAGPEPGIAQVFAIIAGNVTRTFDLRAFPDVGVAVRAQFVNSPAAGEMLHVRLQAVNADGLPTANFTGEGTFKIPTLAEQAFEILPQDQGQKDFFVTAPKAAGVYHAEVKTEQPDNTSAISQTGSFTVTPASSRKVCLMNDPSKTTAPAGILPGMDVKIGDAFGNPVANAPVNFTVTGGQFGSIVAGSGFVPIGHTATGTTDENGRAISPLVQMAGPGTITADITGAPPAGNGAIVEGTGAVRATVDVLPAQIAAPVLDETVPALDAVTVFWFNPVAYDEVRILDAEDGGEIATVPGTNTSYTISGLLPNEPVAVRVVGIVGNRESLPSAARTTFTLAPAPSPADIVVRRAFRGQIELDIVGLNNLVEGLGAVRIERSYDASFTTVRDFGFLTVARFYDTVTPDVEVWYRIAFRNGDGVESGSVIIGPVEATLGAIGIATDSEHHLALGVGQMSEPLSVHVIDASGSHFVPSPAMDIIAACSGVDGERGA